MKSLILFSALTLLASLSARAGTINSSGPRAQALFRALGGDKAAVNGILVVKDVDCEAETELQSGDPGDPGSDLTITTCDIMTADGDSQEYMNVEAMPVRSALIKAGARHIGNSRNGSVKAKQVTCKAESTVHVTCEILN